MSLEKIYKIEQELSDKLLYLQVKNIRASNAYIRSFRKEIRKFFKELEQDIKFLGIENIYIWGYWALEIKVQKLKIKKFFLNNLGFSKSINGLLLKFLTQIEREKRKDIKESKISVAFENKQVQEGEGTLDIKIFEVDKDSIDHFLEKRWTKDKKLWTERLDEMMSPKEKAFFTKTFKSGLDKGLGYQKILEPLKKRMAKNVVRMERIIHTEGQRIQNDILMKSYFENREYIQGIEYTATLDTRTCMVCGAYDGKIFWWDATPRAINAPVIPIHPMCRCVYNPISRSWNLAGEKRASMAKYEAQTQGKFSSWLRRMEDRESGFAKKTLGKNYEKWKTGEWKLVSKNVKLSGQSGTISDYLKREKLKIKPVLKPVKLVKITKPVKPVKPVKITKTKEKEIISAMKSAYQKIILPEGHLHNATFPELYQKIYKKFPELTIKKYKKILMELSDKCIVDLIPILSTTREFDKKFFIKVDCLKFYYVSWRKF